MALSLLDTALVLNIDFRLRIILLLWPSHLNILILLILSYDVRIDRLGVFVSVLVLLFVKAIAWIFHC